MLRFVGFQLFSSIIVIVYRQYEILATHANIAIKSFYVQGEKE